MDKFIDSVSEIVREYPVTPLIGVGGLVIANDSILLIERLHPPSKGEWSIPGGLVNVGETLREAVAREIFEETGLHVKVGDLVELLERIFRDSDGRILYHYIIADYLCEIESGEVNAGSDAAQTKWIGINDLDTLDLAPVTKEVIKKAYDRFQHYVAIDTVI